MVLRSVVEKARREEGRRYTELKRKGFSSRKAHDIASGESEAKQQAARTNQSVTKVKIVNERSGETAFQGSKTEYESFKRKEAEVQSRREQNYKAKQFEIGRASCRERV